MLANNFIHRSHRHLWLACSFATDYKSIIQDWAFCSLNILRNDHSEPGTATTRAVSGYATVLKRLHPSNILLLCPKLSIDVHGFRVSAHRELYHHTLLHVRIALSDPRRVCCLLRVRIGPIWHLILGVIPPR